MFVKLKSIARTLKQEMRAYRLILQDPRTPRTAKILLGLAVAYAAMPFDLIPDWIPVLGYLDDLIFVPILILIAVRFIPSDIIAEAHARVRHSE